MADLFGAAGVRIGSTTDTTATGSHLDLGKPITVESLLNVIDFDLRIPTGDNPGPPDGIYINEDGLVTMVWTAGPPLPASGITGASTLLTQGDATDHAEYAEKTVGQETEVHSLTVEGQPALWFEGAPHSLTFVDAEGRTRQESRLAANVLIWEARNVNHRLETTGDLQFALESVVDALMPLP